MTSNNQSWCEKFALRSLEYSNQLREIAFRRRFEKKYVCILRRGHSGRKGKFPLMSELKRRGERVGCVRDFYETWGCFTSLHCAAISNERKHATVIDSAEDQLRS